MPSIAFLVPGSIRARSGGSIYDRCIAEGLAARGWSVDVHELATAADADGVLASLGDGTVALVDGLISGAIPDVAAKHGVRLRLVPVVHMLRADEPGLPAADAVERHAAERQALSAATTVIATGPATVAALARLGVPAERITLVEPGTDIAPMARGSAGSGCCFLCVATLNHGKGHDVLLRALARNADLPWTLTCVGSTTKEPATAERVDALIRSLDLAKRVTVSGELLDSALDASYAAADAFVLATRFETFGMAVAEALARGLPVISTRTGAIVSLVGEDAGMLVAPDDEAALAVAIRQYLTDAELRDRFRRGALHARARLKPWTKSVDAIVHALTPLAGNA